MIAAFSVNTLYNRWINDVTDNEYDIMKESGMLLLPSDCLALYATYAQLGTNIDIPKDVEQKLLNALNNHSGYRAID